MERPRPQAEYLLEGVDDMAAAAAAGGEREFESVRVAIKCCTRRRTATRFDRWLAFALRGFEHHGRGAVIQVFTSITGVLRGSPMEYQYVPAEDMMELGYRGPGAGEAFANYDPEEEFLLATFYVQNYRRGSTDLSRQLREVCKAVAPHLTTPFEKVVSRVSIGNLVVIDAAFRDAVASLPGAPDDVPASVPDPNPDFDRWGTGPGTACDGCGSADRIRLKACGRCGDAKYCGAECQRDDWPRHKTECGTCKRLRDDTLREMANPDS
ncbi:hypothetical protein JKP88DRAFT_275825 [Tribonema minus]|uniref:MYND-type domain-containing protein n=1 Tax=Tribonema minus TaxID=303371 RepID=A0A835Z7G1_9STRA|nr:hypothetical protein JKP88DRAFT_275825 [Tribonema minus]